jgi:hypothetical protein
MFHLTPKCDISATQLKSRDRTDGRSATAEPDAIRHVIQLLERIVREESMAEERLRPQRGSETEQHFIPHSSSEFSNY